MEKVVAKVSDQVRSEYQRILRHARESNQDVNVGNRYAWHSQTAIQELAKFAKDRQAITKASCVRVLSARLPNYVFGHCHTTQHLREFLTAGGALKILVWTAELQAEGHELLALGKQFPNFEVKISLTEKHGDKLSHFLSVDDVAYRLERPHPPVPPGEFDDFYPEVPAKINFNDTRTGQQLVAFFDDLWAVAFKK